MPEPDILHVGVAVYMYRRHLEERRKARRRYWVKPWMSRRPNYGHYHTLLRELELENPEDFKEYMRMEPAMFYEILQRVTPKITKKDTNFRKSLEPGLKLAITLRFLASGDSYRSLKFNFRVSHNAISAFIPEVCGAILDEYYNAATLPKSEDEWKETAKMFWNRWNLPHCLGAIDGKHIAMKQPAHSGTLYHNYKGFFSMILLGLVDADYRFTWVVVGANGSTSDCAVFNVCDLKEGIENGSLHVPEADSLPKSDMKFPYFLVGDDAFPLKDWLLKPFSARQLTEEERIYNYRISRARRIVENGFGILANRFRCLLGTLQIKPDNVSSVVLACVCLHNVMRDRYPTLQNRDLDKELEDGTYIPGAWRTEALMHEIEDQRAPTPASRTAKKNRVMMKHYVNQIGTVPWQWNIIH